MPSRTFDREAKPAIRLRAITVLQARGQALQLEPAVRGGLGCHASGAGFARSAIASLPRASTRARATGWPPLVAHHALDGAAAREVEL